MYILGGVSMITGSGSSTEHRKCVVCGKKSGNYRTWSYIDGIEISVPICRNCKDKIGWCLDKSMDIHLKGIKESVRHSIIITSNEKALADMGV